MMTRASKVGTIALVFVLGVWGCARGPANGNATLTERVQSLESKCAKLEEENKAVAGAREQLRRRVAALENDNARLQKELANHQAIVKERDALKQVVDTRTSERDQLQVRCDRLKKGLQSLLGQDDAMITPPAGSVPLTAGPNGAKRNPS
jgi:septal ring factor EnvC (AmiA/AmiB activator)